jgi:membrane protease YdiL (CAAX protease family)
MAGPAGPVSPWRRAAATAMPVALPLLMQGAFSAASRRFGPHRGYQAGFAVYWAACWGVAAAVAGPGNLAARWRRPEAWGPRPGTLAWVGLAVPPLGAVVWELVPNRRAASPAAIATAVGVGVTNALAEETLWRGLPVTVFPDDPLRGWLWPTAGFVAWHLVPLSAGAADTRTVRRIIGGSAVIGLVNGWIAVRTRSLVAVGISHALTDSCGLKAAHARWLPAASGGPTARGHGN